MRQALFWLALYLVGSAQAALISIDFGTKFNKVGFVKPGKFDLVLNEESKRKSASVIAIKDDERLFGNSAIAWVNSCLAFRMEEVD